MKKIHFEFIKLGVLLLILAFLVTQTNAFNHLFNPRTVYAIGDLTVDWGIGTGDVGPIFTVNNMAPGDTEPHDVTVTNGASSSRPVGVIGLLDFDTGNLSDVLHIVISRNGTPVYGAGSSTGDRTLTQFFTDSSGPDGILLFTQTPGNVSLYTFSVNFDTDADNTYQNLSLQFDLKVGLSIDVPEACESMTFSSPIPIFGTQKSDALTGTNGNDLIFALEGHDSINGRGGDDCIVAGTGSDAVDAQGGSDVVLGGDGSDLLRGGSGHDQLIGGNGSDALVGNGGNDLLQGGNGSDSASGGAGTDTCEAESESSCEV